ncbi:hypothetical protein [Streptomyces sp. NPDC058466]|uniref:hypothetical protein n=1 Tax=Streptomyces sp. NPDC058466 TaxID=3346512 RepID=UPI003655498F
MTTTPRPISDLDVPLPTLRERMAAIVAGQRSAQILAEAAKHTASPSDHLAYDLDAWLVRHPEAPLSTDADYPGFAEYVAAREADNRKARQAHLEAS